jgi:uncharacterized protein with HEPN domain
MQRDPALLLDILLMARDAVGFTDGMDREDFLADRRTQYAVVRCPEVIGEAGKTSRSRPATGCRRFRGP